MDLVGALAHDALHAPQCGDSLWGRPAAAGSTTAAAATAAPSHPEIHSGRAARSGGETGDASSVGAIASLPAGSAGYAGATKIGAARRRAFSACGGNVRAATDGARHQQGVGSRRLAERGLIVSAGCVRSEFIGGLLLLSVKRQLLEAAGGQLILRTWRSGRCCAAAWSPWASCAWACCA